MKAFAGPDYDVPVFEPEARHLLFKVEPIARHYRVRKALHLHDFDRSSLQEIRHAWKMPGEFNKMPLAKLTPVDSRKIWKLFWKRASGKWVAYEPKASARALSDLVAEIDTDAYGCVFG